MLGLTEATGTMLTRLWFKQTFYRHNSSRKSVASFLRMWQARRSRMSARPPESRGFIRHAMRAAYATALIIAAQNPLSAQNPPTNYTAATVPYGGTESWYCEVVTGTLNRRCSFADLNSSITSLPNLIAAAGLTTTGTITTGGAAGAGFNLNLGTISYTGTLPNAQLSFSLPLSIANGGTGTTTPSLVAGTGVSLSGSWPAQTVTVVGNNQHTVTPSNPATTTATTFKMMGLGSTATIVPGNSSYVVVNFFGVATIGAANGACQYQIRYDLTSAPANGAAVTGTQLGSTIVANMLTTQPNLPISMNGLTAGLANGNTYWFDIAVDAFASGPTCGLSNVTISLYEIP